MLGKPSTSPVPKHPASSSSATATPTSKTEDSDWAIRLEKEKRMSQQLSAKNEALNSQQQFVVERAADFSLQQQQRIAELEAQLGAAAPSVPGDGTNDYQHHNNNNNSNYSNARSGSGTTGGGGIINVRHGCPRCSTCSTLLQTVSQLEQMLQNRDSDCDMLRKSLDDSQRVNALLLEQIDLLQRGLEKAMSNRSIPQNFQGTAPSLPLHHSVSPQPAGSAAHHHQHQASPSVPNPNDSSSASNHEQQQQQQHHQTFNSSALPTNVRMLQPSSEPTLRAMADAVQSLQNLWLGVGGPSPSRSQPPAVPANKLLLPSSDHTPQATPTTTKINNDAPLLLQPTTTNAVDSPDAADL